MLVKSGIAAIYPAAAESETKKYAVASIVDLVIRAALETQIWRKTWGRHGRKD